MAQTAKTKPSAPTARARLSDIAYDRILEGLFDRRVPVGAFVSQGELSSIIDVPIAPLRDALRVLESEGILTIHPRSGIQFVRPGLELTRATFQFRAIIERSAVREFAETGDEEVMQSLELQHSRLIRQIERHGVNEDIVSEIDRLENAFHSAIVEALRNPLIETTYRRIHNYLRLLRLERKMTAPLLLRTLSEHLDILDACTKRDADAAEAAIQAHFRAAIHRNVGLI
ncbi:GntR family transcriptional regulator [Martelella sp. FOR1707]